MRGFFKALGWTTLGLVAGALITSHVWVNVVRTLPDDYHAQYLMTQEFLGNRATRAGDDVGAALHAVNLAEARGERHFRWIARDREIPYYEWFLRPWQHQLEARGEETDPGQTRRDSRILEAHDRARAAVAFERLGRPDLAAPYWSAAHDLMPSHSVDEHRQYLESNPGIPALEDAYLDSSTRSELAQKLAEARRQLGVAEY